MNRKRLEQVLRIREIQERGARGEMVRTTMRHRRARSVESHTWNQLDAWPADGPTAQGLDGLDRVRGAGMLAADTQHAATERAAGDQTVARAEWTVAARRVEALERLAERLRESEAEEAERLQNNEIDDMVLARRGREQR